MTTMPSIFIIESEPQTAPLLAGEQKVRVVGCATTVSAALQSTPASDFILMSARLPETELVRLHELRTIHSCIVITDVDEREDRVLPLLEAGAAGYLRQDAQPEEMLSTLNAIQEGKAPLAPSVGTALVTRLHELLVLQQQEQEVFMENCADLSALTTREREILTLIRSGASNQEIAGQLTIELGTVKNHVHNILKKLHVTRRDRAARYLDLLEQIK